MEINNNFLVVIKSNYLPTKYYIMITMFCFTNNRITQKIEAIKSNR